MERHEHVPRRITTILNDKQYNLGLCRYGKVLEIERWHRTIERTRFILSWEPVGDWRAATEREQTELDFWGA